MGRRMMFFVLVLASLAGCRSNELTSEKLSGDTTFYHEPFRPQIHFSPQANWMNDPNGLVYYKGVYHLFYQYYPDSTVWGPMHWGHATSGDLVHWSHMPIALYPDSLGLIFSGSAVVDTENSSGFGTKENPPIVAMFTYHSREKEKAGLIDYQYQGIAYSLDEGKTWIKYFDNPVIKNPGIKDFRDPKIFWHEPTKKWIVILAVLDHTEMWGSVNLKNWQKLSEFGQEYGAHGGVWECPDLFELKVDGEKESRWVMLVSINPGGPNGGSATQYFVGDFDGTTFTPNTGKDVISWLDYGPDNYAGVTWANVEDGRKIFIGWMSNWAYAQEVPTSPWRSAMTAPRDLSLTGVGNRLFVTSAVAPEFYAGATELRKLANIDVVDSLLLTGNSISNISTSILTMTLDAKAFEIELFNSRGDKLIVLFDQPNNRFVIDRSEAGNTDFSKDFPVKTFAPRISSASKISLSLVVDEASVEVFFDDGLTVMTSAFFTDQPLSQLKVSGQSQKLYKVEFRKLDSIWK